MASTRFFRWYPWVGAWHAPGLFILFIIALAANSTVSADSNLDRLYEAAGDGDNSLVEQLLSQGADVNSRSSSGSYALNAAAVSNHHTVIRTLLSHGADVNVQNKQGDTPLICATKYAGGDEQTVKLLVEAGTDINIADSVGKTALDYAAMKGQETAMAIIQRPK